MLWGEEAEIVGKRATELHSTSGAGEGTADRPRRLPKPAASASRDHQLSPSRPGGEAAPPRPPPGGPAWQLSPLGREAARET